MSSHRREAFAVAVILVFVVAAVLTRAGVLP